MFIYEFILHINQQNINKTASYYIYIFDNYSYSI